jgi:hypothetical protein
MAEALREDRAVRSRPQLWQEQIRPDGTNKYLGHFADPEDAADLRQGGAHTGYRHSARHHGSTDHGCAERLVEPVCVLCADSHQQQSGPGPG